MATIFSLKHTLNKNILITFESKELLKVDYIYIEKEGKKNYFRILEVSSNKTSKALVYKAQDCGYGLDKLSSFKTLDLREYLDEVIFEVHPDDIQELRKRSSYN